MVRLSPHCPRYVSGSTPEILFRDPAVPNLRFATTGPDVEWHLHVSVSPITVPAKVDP